MKKKISIILVVVLCLFCIIASILLIVNNDSMKKATPEEEDLNYIDRSSYEEEVRKSTGNPYYTVSTSRQLATNRTYDGLELKDPWLVRISQNLYSFTCILHNNTESEYPAQAVVVRFVDKEGKIIDEEDSQIFSIPVGEMRTVSVTTNLNILSAYDFKIVPKNA